MSGFPFNIGGGEVSFRSVDDIGLKLIDVCFRLTGETIVLLQRVVPTAVLLGVRVSGSPTTRIPSRVRISNRGAVS